MSKLGAIGYAYTIWGIYGRLVREAVYFQKGK